MNCIGIFTVRSQKYRRGAWSTNTPLSANSTPWVYLYLLYYIKSLTAHTYVLRLASCRIHGYILYTYFIFVLIDEDVQL